MESRLRATADEWFQTQHWPILLLRSASGQPHL